MADATTLLPSATTVDAEIIALATKFDPANGAELGAIVIALLRYGLKKAEAALNKSATGVKYAAPIQAAEAAINAAV